MGHQRTQQRKLTTDDSRQSRPRAVGVAAVLFAGCAIDECGAVLRYDDYMERCAADVLKDALALPVDARGALIDCLIDSLDRTEDPNSDAEWRKEIERRVQQIENRSVESIPWAEGRHQLRSALPR